MSFKSTPKITTIKKTAMVWIYAISGVIVVKSLKQEKNEQ
jgi:hypothetical protein